MMRKLSLALALVLWSGLAWAQNAGWPPPAGALAFLCVYNSSLPTLTTGQDGFAQCDSSGRLIVTNPQSPPLGTTGGWTPIPLAALGNTAVAIKATAGQLGWIYCSNADATHWAYVQVFNLAAASVMVGTTVAVGFFGIPPSSSGGLSVSLVGTQFSTAISAAATSTATGGTGPNTAPDCSAGFN